MCSKYTVTFGGWNEKQSFSSYFKVLCAFFTTKIVIVCFAKVVFFFSDKCAFKHLKIPMEVREQPDIYHALPLCWYPYRGFFFIVSLF